jgi:hypothetical protein
VTTSSSSWAAAEGEGLDWADSREVNANAFAKTATREDVFIQRGELEGLVNLSTEYLFSMIIQ